MPPSQMSTKQVAGGNAPQGFALFSNQAYARQAMMRINDLSFERDHHLRVSMHGADWQSGLFR